MFVLLVTLLLQHSDRVTYAANLKGNPAPSPEALTPTHDMPPNVEALAVATSELFHQQIQTKPFDVETLRAAHHPSATEIDSGKISASHAARNLLVSIVLLIGIFVAASFTLRQSVDPGKSYRQCPFAVYLPGYNSSLPPLKSKFEGDGVEDGKSLSEAVGIDWDTVAISNKFSCVFDPSKLPIDNLMSMPPPSFKSKVDVGLDHFRNIFTPTSNEYVSISE